MPKTREFDEEVLDQILEEDDPIMSHLNRKKIEKDEDGYEFDDDYKSKLVDDFEEFEPTEDDFEEVEKEMENENDSEVKNDKDEPPAKRRGRPRKVLSEVSKEDAPVVKDNSDQPTPKTRGRPPKNTSNDVKEIKDSEEVKVKEVRKSSRKETSVSDVEKDKFSVHLKFVNEKGYEHIEFGNHVFMYKKIVDPDKKMHDYFEGFYKHIDENTESESKWIPMKALLSDRYHVVQMDKFIEDLQTQLKFKKTNLKHSPFYFCWEGTTNEKLESFEDEGYKTMFEIFSGIENPGEELNGRIGISLINSYNGTTTFRANYNINLSSKESRTTFTDYFTLSNKSYKIVHAGNIKQISSTVDDIQKTYKENIEHLKECTNKSFLNKLVENVAPLFHKKEVENFIISSWESIPGEFKNLFYLLLLISNQLSNNYSVQLHHTLHTYISKQIEKI